MLEKKLQGRGMKLLYAVAWPGQGIYTKDPLKSVERLQGPEDAHLQPAHLAARRAAGRERRPIAQVPDVPQMFATGAMHAMVTSSATGTSTKAWEFVKNYYKTNAWNPKNVVVVNERAFGRLPKDQQDGIVKAAAAAEPRGWDMSQARARRDADEMLAKNGVTVQEPSRRAEGRARARSASRWPPSGRSPPAPTARRSSKPTKAK